MTTNSKLYQRSWDIENPKAVVLLVHGLAEHTERYSTLGNYLTINHYALMAIDLPGHGRSDGTRGHIDRFSHFHDAIRNLYASAQKKYPDTDIFLLGHSMGGLISTQFLLNQQTLFKGALLSGPALETPQKPPAWQVNIIRLIAKLFPKLGLLQLDASGISQDPAVVKKYMNDPLIYKGKLSAQFLVEMFYAMKDCIKHSNKITLPLMIMHGSNDVITSPSGSNYLYEHVSSNDKTLKIYDGLFHEIFNEPSAKVVYDDLITWLDSHN